ncbi:hypothetical protein KSP39_PZI017915 [Platanthera zijinensis]|uniref:Ubiquitin-like protease family profile domain-containing protein n=1 Tax=Platanthera zijinensis TaxID=2320716 RepID=A0AAP0FZK0_9ASPA
MLLAIGSCWWPILKKTWDFYDSMSNPTHKTPIQNHMRYLQEDTGDVLPIDIALWPLRIVEGLPTQDNDNDCGIFVMKYMAASVVEGPVDWSSHKVWGKDMLMIRAEMVASFCQIFQSSLLTKHGFNF